MSDSSEVLACLSVRLLEGGMQLKSHLRHLLNSRWSWVWESELGSLPETETILPARRETTYLTDDTLSDFVADAQQRSVDGYGRFMALFGLMPRQEEVFRERGAAAAVRDFLNDFGPLEIIVVRGADWPTDYICAKRSAVTDLRSTLEEWGVDATGAQTIPSARAVETFKVIYGLE